jgi:8-oxo-dGTP pyrophosphatase MutT (NUDIX family)
MAYHRENGVKFRLHHNFNSKLMQLNYWAPHVTVAAIIEREGKFLLVEEVINGETVINQPAGHLDNNESLLDAVVRETLEETRWDFEPLYISGIYRWKHDNGETYLRICFVGNVTQEHPELALDTGIESTLWLPAEELKNNSRFTLRSPLVEQCINDYQSGHRYPLSLVQDIC